MAQPPWNTGSFIRCRCEVNEAIEARKILESHSCVPRERLVLVDSASLAARPERLVSPKTDISLLTIKNWLITNHQVLLKLLYLQCRLNGIC